MKRLLLIAMLLFASVELIAQTDGMSYQAVIINPNPQEIPGVDASGNILPNKSLAVRFTISNSNGSIEFQETHSTTTDVYGMINLVIGHGSSSVGSFSEIVWDGTQKDLKVEINLEGNYKDLSEQALLFTPYAFHRDIIATGDLTVGGKIGFSGNLEVDGTTILNNTLMVANGSSTNLTGILNVDGKTTLNDALVVANSSPSELSGKLTVLGATQLNNSLDVSGATGIDNSLTVSGQHPTVLTGTLGVDGVTNLNNTLNVTNGSPVNLSGDLKIGGVLELGNDLTVNGITNLNKELKVNNQSPTLLTGQLNVDGPTALNNELQVSGATNLNGSLSVNNESPTGLTGTLTVDKETTLNNSLTVTNESPTNLTGTLTVDKETALNNALTVTNESPTKLTGTLTVNKETALNNSLTVTNESPTNLTGTLTVDKETLLNKTLIVANESPTNLTGKLTVDGASIFNNTLDVKGAFTLGDDLTVNGTTNLNSSLSVNNGSTANLTGMLKVDGETELNNRLIVVGGTYLYDYLIVGSSKPTVLTGTLKVNQEAILNNSLTVNNAKPTILTGALAVEGVTNLNNSLSVNNQTPTTLTGTLGVDGATVLNNTLNITNAKPAHFTGTFNVDGATFIDDDFTVTGTTTLEDLNLKKIDIKSDNDTHVATFENTNNAGGDGIIIKLGRKRANDGLPEVSYDEADPNDIVKYTKLLNVQTSTSDKISLIVEIAEDMGEDTLKFIAEMALGVGNLIIEFINDGLGLPMTTRDIAVGLNGHDPVLHDIIDNGIDNLDVDTDDWLAEYNTPEFKAKLIADSQDPDFEYLDCWDDDLWCEALDGFIDDDDLYYDHGWDTIIPEIPIIEIDGLDIPDLKSPEFWGVPNITFSDFVSNPLNTQNEFISFVDKDNNRMGAIKAQSVVNWTTSKITPGFIYSLKNALFSSKLDKAHARAHFKGLIKDILVDYTNIGVQYSSGNGDYAEWLERSDSKEFISTGDIVGVKGGKITRDLTDAEQVMAVSERPIVLGNIPEDGKLYLGNNIAFMGQIPVKVMGAVHSGDYIVGKGIVKGYGIAISPENMTIDDFKMAVGRAWEANESAGPKMVNTVVGVHNGDYIKILKKYKEKFQESEVRIQSVEAKIDVLTELITKKNIIK